MSDPPTQPGRSFALALARALGGLSLVAVGACVAPGDPPSGVPPLVKASACEGRAPSCVSSCAEPDVIGAATCGEGTWRCDRGVRDDLCCDPEEALEHCPEWGDLCAPGRACGPGYTCVSARSWPIPADEGVCRLGDWTIPEGLGTCATHDVLRADLLPGLGPAAIKVEGVVAVVPSCDGRRCDASNPCCQRCTGAYTLELPREGAAPLAIGLRTETLSCVGTNCGFSCAPLQPGRRYRVWGMWIPDTGAAAPGSLFVAGSCAD